MCMDTLHKWDDDDDDDDDDDNKDLYNFDSNCYLTNKYTVLAF